MLNQEQQSHLAGVTRTLQIIIAALAMGVFVFAVVAILQRPTELPPDKLPLLTIIFAVFSVAAFLASVIVPKILVAGARHSLLTGTPMTQVGPPPPAEVGDAGPLASVYQTQLIIKATILEGAAFGNLVALLQEGQMISLGFATALLLAIIFQVPTQSRVAHWVESEIQTLEQLRQLEGPDQHAR